MLPRTHSIGRIKGWLLVCCLVAPSAADVSSQTLYEFVTPLFGLATVPDGSLVVADAGAGMGAADVMAIS